MRERRYRKEVPADLSDAALWYESRSTGLGERFLRVVELTMHRIEEHPVQFRVLHQDFRRALLPRPFPYQIFFRINGAYVDIYAVLHGARDPEAWKERL